MACSPPSRRRADPPSDMPGQGQRYVGKRFTGAAADEPFSPEQTLVFGEGDVADRFADTAAAMHEASIGSVCAVPLVVGDRGLGTLTVGRRELDAFPGA